MKDVIGSLLSILLAFVLLGVTSIYYVGIIQWAESETQALSYTRSVIDEVIDTRELTDATKEDYDLLMSSLANYYSFEIIRQVKIVEPDPLNPGGTYTSYMTVSDNKHYEQGDLIIINVKPVGLNVAQAVGQSFLGMTSLQDGFSLAGRVR